MSRSNYSYENDNPGLWRGAVASAIRGKRGQAFLSELSAALDAMPEKALIAGELVRADGACCTIGVVCKARALDVSKVDYEDPDSVARAVGLAMPMAAEIEYMNDEWGATSETPQERWTRMRQWVQQQISP